MTEKKLPDAKELLDKVRKACIEETAWVKKKEQDGVQIFEGKGFNTC